MKKDTFLKIISYLFVVFLIVSNNGQTFSSNLEKCSNVITHQSTNNEENSVQTSQYNITKIQEDLEEDIPTTSKVFTPISSTIFSTNSETIEPFYYLDATLENYYQLANCHGFVGEKFSPTTGGELTDLTGEGLTICVIDEGVAYNHSYFSKGYNSYIYSKIIINSDGGTRNPSTGTDFDDHATECVSSIKQIAPKAKIISIGCQDLTDDGLLLGAFRWVYDNYENMNMNIKIVSMSLTRKLEYIPSTSDQILDYVKQLSGNKNFGSTTSSLLPADRVIFNFAVGNEPRGSSYDYAVKWPANFANLGNVFGIGGSNYTEQRIKYDGTDSIHNTDSNIKLNLLAPGELLKVASITENSDVNEINETVVTTQGSSLSTPMTAGAIALALEKYGLGMQII